MKTKTLIFCITIIVLVTLMACASPTIQTSTSSVPSTIAQSSTATATAAPTTAAPIPQGELVGALSTFGNENFLPWLDASNASMDDLVYDMLIYWDGVNRKFIPGLAESWDVSTDGLTTTYHIRKGVQFHDGWGEVSSADVKYFFEASASPKSIGKVAQTRRISSMDTPDPYTLVVHFKEPYPIFFSDLSLMVGATCQGIVCKKYIDTVGEEAASQKPIGTGPYKYLESKSGDYFKFEALDSHWRVVPEFKALTVRLITEMSTTVAALKTKEIDVACNIAGEQMEDLKAAGVAVEVSPVGGFVVMLTMGGMVIPEDKRYDPNYHLKDPWTDTKVRKAMAIAIDREAICKSIYAGYASPLSVPLSSADMNNYQYPYDPAAAKQLLKEAGYPNGFSFKAISYVIAGAPETPRLVEALAGYWQAIGLDPKITVIDYATYKSKYQNTVKNAGEISVWRNSSSGDQIGKMEQNLLPNVVTVVYEDQGSYAIYKDNPKGTYEERLVLTDKLNKHYFENVGPIPVVRAGACFGWNADKVLQWPHGDGAQPTYWEYVRHAQPIKTFRLFNPWPDR